MVLIPTIPKDYANQGFTLKRYIGRTGPYGKAAYDDPIEINNCVFQKQTVYSGTNENRSVIANALIILYAGVTEPMPQLSKSNYESKITYQGEEFTLKSVNEILNPLSNELWSLELEAI